MEMLQGISCGRVQVRGSRLVACKEVLERTFLGVSIVGYNSERKRTQLRIVIYVFYSCWKERHRGDSVLSWCCICWKGTVLIDW